MVIHTPPMGWNTWNTFGPDINEDLLLRSADALVDTGLAAAGYNYLVIDDCWSLKQRDANGRLVADPEKFPHGMKYVADYVHSKGLKFGMYSCAGQMTCACYPGSFDHEFVDAATFAEWGVDYLKYDYCFHPATRSGQDLYRRMGLALANCGRDIVFSGCSWGADKTKEWIASTGCHLWRSNGDINDSWASIKFLATEQLPDQVYGRINCFNDMDMLVVGMGGKGNVGLTGCTDEEYRTHFALWAILNSPLIIGCDITKMSDAAKEILTNKELIAINQDVAGRQTFMVGSWLLGPEHFCIGKLLENGDIAIGLFNLSDEEKSMFFGNEDLGLAIGTGKKLELHDVYTGEVTPMENELFFSRMAPHTSRVWRAKVVDC